MDRAALGGNLHKRDRLDERLAQGKDNARKVFESNQALMDELEAKVRAMADKLSDNSDEFELDDDDDFESFELETLSED